MVSGLRWLATVGLCAVAACGGQTGPPLRIVLAHAATPDARCFVPGGGAQPADEPLQGVNLGGLTVATVRLSIRTYSAPDVAGNFLCDRVLNVPRDVPSLRIPKNGATSIDIYAEAFAPLVTGESIPRRVAVGGLLGVPLGVKALPDLRLYPDERFRCAGHQLNRARAFHTATPLPNGQVLIVGGLTPTADAAADEAFGAAPVFVTADAEIFDPSTGELIAVSESDAPVPRAFHQAAFVGTSADGKYQVLLVGGATTAATTAAFGLNTGAAPGTRLVPFDTSGSLLNPLPTAGAAAELLTYDPATHTATRSLMAGFTPSVYQAGAGFADGLAVAGGIDWMGTPLQATLPTVKKVEVARALETPRSAALLAARMGATMTPLSDDSALIWGGQITPTDAAGEFVTGLGSNHTLKVVSVALAAAPPTQFHTATLLPADAATPNRTLLVTGGFIETTMNMGQALQPPAAAQAARLVTVTPAGVASQAAPTLSGYTLDATCADPARYRPAGWESAVDVGRGRVLVSGGAPTVTGSCNDCDGGSDARCATGQASLFTAPTTLAPTTERMQVARYGHTATLMRDGNVLIVGGITAAGAAPRMLRDVEVYNPRPVTPLFDAASGSPDPDDPVAVDLAASQRTREPGKPVSADTLCGEL